MAQGQSQESQSHSLANVSFLALLTGQVVSIFGDRLNNIALIELLSERTARFVLPGSTFELSKLALAMTLPSLLLGPLVGTYVDRVSRKRVLIVTDGIRAILVLILVVLPRFPLWIAYSVVGMLYFANLFFLPARCAIVPEIVDKSHLVRANSMLSVGATVATIAGFAGGGIIATRAGWRFALGIDAATYLFSAFVLALIHPRFSHLERSHPRPVGFKTIGEVVKRVRGKVRDALLAPMFMVIAASIAYVIGVAIVERSFRSGTMYVGFLVGLAGAGMTMGCIMTSSLLRRVKVSQAMFAGCIASIIPIGALGISANIGFLSVLVLISGFAAGPVFVTSETTIQKELPQRSQATVFALRDMVMKAALMGGAWMASSAATLVGAKGALVTLTGLCAITAVLVLQPKD